MNKSELLQALESNRRRNSEKHSYDSGWDNAVLLALTLARQLDDAPSMDEVALGDIVNRIILLVREHVSSGQTPLRTVLCQELRPYLRIPQPSVSAEMHPVFAYLLGEGKLEGRGFGTEAPLDNKTGRRLPYWWRKHLREALAAMQQKEALWAW